MKKLYILLLLLFCGFYAFSQKKPTSIITGELISVSPPLSSIKYTSTPDPRKLGRKFAKNGDEKEEKKIVGQFYIEESKIDEANHDPRVFVNNPMAISSDPVIQLFTNSQPTNAPTGPILTFDGTTNADNSALFGGTVNPPDPNLCVGPNHVVMMGNLAHKIFDKAGNLLVGPLKFSSIAPGSTDDGDPICIYDQMADRYLLLQFDIETNVDNNSLYFCISKTNDPTGAYYVYKFNTPGVFPDYPHVGIWNNSYIVTTHEFNLAGNAYLGQGYYAVDRNKMVEGFPTTTLIRFQDPNQNGYLPVTLEGANTPDASSPALFITIDADEFGSAADGYLLNTLTPDFAIPANSTMSAATFLPSASFDPRSPSGRTDVQQPSPGVNVDALTGRMMSKIIYRKFDNSESIVMNHTVNVSGVNPTTPTLFQAAMRWTELTRPNSSSPWVINQESTYSPDAGNGATGNNRWMGSTGIDQKGNIALAYSRSSTTNNPDIYYAERKKSDALGTLSSEALFYPSGGVQTSSNSRWGDYTSMVTDPVDGETLWYVNEYYPVTSTTGWRNRIGSFKVNDPITTPTVHFKLAGTIAQQKDAIPTFKDYLIQIVIDNAPTQPVNVTLAHTGDATQGVDYDIINGTGITLSAGNLVKEFTFRVYNDALDEPNEFVEFTYTLNVNGGNAIPSNYNQKHKVTIIGKVNCLFPSISYTCSGQIATLSGACNEGTLKWYDASGLNLQASGSPFVTPSLSGPTTYNARCEGTDCSSNFNKITVFPARLYVNSTATNGSNSGSDWANAFLDLQSALNLVCKSNLTEIWVAKGTYKPTTCTICDLSDVAKNVSFNIPTGVKVYGGFAGTEVNLSDRNLALALTTNKTTLSGDLKNDDGINFTNMDDNTKTIVKFINSNNTTHLDGFTILGGNAINTGGGVNVDLNSSPEISNCIFSGNASTGAVLDQQNTSITNSGFGFNSTSWVAQTFTPTVSGNLTKADIYLFCSGCTGTSPNLTMSLRATSAGVPTGSDLASATITGFNSGAGSYFSVEFSSPPSISAGTQYALVLRAVSNPSAGVYAYVVSTGSPYPGGSRVISTNSGSSWTSQSTDLGFKTYISIASNGGGILNNGTLKINNSILSKNNSSGTGGAIYNNGALSLINNTITGNTASSGGAISNNGASGITTLNNNIAFGNTNSFANSAGGATNATFSFFDDITNVNNNGNNIINVVTPFVSPTDLHLACTSPAINMGTSTNAPLKDIEGNSRPFVGAVSLVDMGAFEFQGDLTFTASSNSPVNVGGTINLSTSGGTSYSWSGPNSFTSTDQNPMIASATLAMAGTYTVTVTYGSSCTATATTNVIVNSIECVPPSSPIAGSNSPVNVGGALNLTSSATGGTSYSWTGPNSFTSVMQNPMIASATLAMAGTYTVTITSTGTCTATSTTIVVINSVCVPPTSPMASSNSPVNVGGALNLTASATGGTGYSWSGPNSFTSTIQNPMIASATLAMAGTYTVTITSTGTCTATATTNVVVNTVCVPPTSPTASSNSPICVGNPLNLSSSGGSSYSWAGPNSFSSAMQNPSISSATSAAGGIYTVTISNGPSCTATATTSVTINTTFMATATSNSPICEGNNLNLSTSCQADINAAMNGLNEVTSNGSTATGNVTGTFDAATSTLNLNVSFSGLNGGNATAAHIHNAAAGVNGSVIITLTGFPASSSGIYNNNYVLTSPQAAQLLAGNLYVNIHNTTFPGGEIRGQIAVAPCNSTYAWTGPNSFSSNTQNPSINAATIAVSGVYTVTISNGVGCSATATTSVTVNSIPIASISGSDNLNCTLTTVSRTASGGVSYVWSPGLETTETINISSPGTYTVTITGSGGCTATATTNVSQNIVPPNVSISGSDNITCAMPIVTRTAIGTGTYLWSNGLGTNATVSISSAGTYTVTITVSNGCTATATTLVTAGGGVFSGNITSQPISSTICQGNHTTFSTSATGVGISYQWQVNMGTGFINVVADGNFSNVTSPTLIVTFPPVSMNGYQFRCKVSDTNCSINSDVANLTVQIAAEAITIVNISPINSDMAQQAVSFIVALNKVNSPAKVQFFAGNSINLIPGFEVKAGAVFTAKIQNPCSGTTLGPEGKGIPELIEK